MKWFVRFFVINLLTVTFVYSQVVINEFCASNSAVIADNAGDYDDWVEIYNAGENPVNLHGYFLTDSPKKPVKWALPDTTLPSHGFILIWADDDVEQGSVHTNFKLDADGEFIGITNGTIFLDSLSFSAQQTDVSLGRKQDGDPEWILFYSPTPGASNIPLKLPPPHFSHEPGFYSSPFQLTLQSDYPNTWIIYSLDSRYPSVNSHQYQAPIEISRTTIIRAYVCGNKMQPSDTVTYIYLFDLHPNLDVLSLVTDPKYLYGAVGIIDHPDQREWERPVSATYFSPNGNLQFKEEAGLRLHGLSSRNYDKKSFRLYFRDEYGQDELPYPLFSGQKDIQSFKRLVLHANATDMPCGDESDCWSLIRNALAYRLCRLLNIPYTANKIVNVILNGEPYGLYTLLERIDDHFIESNYGHKEVDLIEKDQTGYSAKEGDVTAWEEMLRFFATHEISNPEDIEAANAYFDMNEYFRYYIIEIYSGNMDWLLFNQLTFRPRDTAGKWRWILWDMDKSFGYRSYLLHYNGLAYALNPGTIQYELDRNEHSSAFIFKRLLENDSLKNRFINTFADQLNTQLSSSNVLSLIDSLSEAIKGDIGFEITKWGSNQRVWENNIDRLREFASTRPDMIREYICDQFSINSTVSLELQVNDNDYGSIRVHSQEVRTFPWTGVYFKNIPLDIEALPNPGYHFSQWRGSGEGTQSLISLPLDTNYSLTAVFEPDTVTPVKPMQLTSVPDTGYYPIEYCDTLIVTGGTPPYTFIRDTIAGIVLNEAGILSGVPVQTGVFTDSISVADSDPSHSVVRFPLSLIILPRINLITVPDTGYYHVFYCDTLVVTGAFPPFTFTPDTIAGLRLCRAGILSGVPSETGVFTEYITIQDSNPSVPSASFVLTIIILPQTSVSSELEVPETTRLFKNYPNPFNHETEIGYEIHQAGRVTIRIYDILGRKIRLLVDSWQTAGEYKIRWDGKSRDGRIVPSGVYVYVLKTGLLAQKRKMILVQ